MQNNTKLTLKLYIQHLRKYWLAFFVTIFFLGSAAVLTVVTPLYMKDFINYLAGGLANRTNITSNLLRVLMYIAILHIFEWISWRAATYYAAYIDLKVTQDLANTCFRYLHKLSFNFFNSNFVGSLVKRVNWFTRAFADILDAFFWNIFLLVIRIGLMVFVIFKRNLILGWSLVGWIFCFLIINAFFVRYKLKYDLKRNAAETKISGILADTITNNSNVKLFNGYNQEMKTYENAVSEATKWRKISFNLNIIFEAGQSFLAFALEIGMLYLAIGFWQKDLLTIGDFVLLQAYVLSLIDILWNSGRSIRRVYNNLADAEEMTVILNTPPEIIDAPEAKKLKINEGKVEFKDVDFNYNETRKILGKFNLTINPKEKVALVGPSGAGKSTIIRLLLRMYEVTGGKILIDNQKISTVKMESLWDNISMVPQDPILFHRTLMENIRYGKPNATNEEVVRAAKLAHCHEFIKEFPDGYNTYVGERGIKLSGGERQRVAIARAILHNAPILILDEATSSLDSESEQLIQKALDNLIKDKTVIVVAHRLSTIMKMDRIIVIKDGAIYEIGSHQELLQKNDSLYKRLWEVQAGGFIG